MNYLPRILYFSCALALFSCSKKQHESALKYVPLEVNSLEVTNWNVLKMQFGINSENEFYNHQNWTEGKSSPGLVWSFDLKLRDRYLKSLGFTYPDVEFETVVNIKPFHQIHIMKYSPDASIEPMKVFLRSENYKKQEHDSFIIHQFVGAEKELRAQMESGVIFYYNYKFIAYNQAERIVIFANYEEDLLASINAGKSGNNITRNSDFDFFMEKEKNYFTFRISTSPYSQVPSFSNLGRMQDYEIRLSEYLSLEQEELHLLKQYRSYYLAISFDGISTQLDAALIYQSENDLNRDQSLRRKIIEKGRLYSDHSLYSDHVKKHSVEAKENKLFIQLQSTDKEKDFFYKTILLGDLGFLLVYQSEGVEPASSSH